MANTLTQEVINSDKFEVFAFVLAKRVEKYFQDDEHKRQFEEWYREKYGKEYEWR